MHLGFVDIAYGYAADRPDGDASLGGTTSAVCYLARELVKVGVACTFFNRKNEAVTALGIPSLPLDALAEECLKPRYSAFIFCGRWAPPMVQLIRQATKAPLIAWMHESSFNDKLVQAISAFDGVSFVSNWQQKINQPFIKPRWKQAVIRNAMSPFAENLFAKDERILSAKTQPPILLFAGTVPRGVMHLPPILDELRKYTEDFAVEIFCNTNPSGHVEQDAKYISWLRSLPNITHVGMVGQKALAQRMKSACIFVAPNPWPETSCIALIEAMAAGLQIITTNRAALPETAAGYAQHIAIEDADHSYRFDMPISHKKFAQAVLEKLDKQAQQPESVEQDLRSEMDYAQSHYQWRQRAKPWIDFVSGFTV